MFFIIHLVLLLDRKPMSNDGTVIYKERLPLSSNIRAAYAVNSRLVDTPYRTGAKFQTKTTQKFVHVIPARKAELWSQTNSFIILLSLQRTSWTY